MPWEMLPKAFWRHFKSQKNIFVGLEIQFYARKGPFLAFLTKIVNLRPILLPQLIPEPIFMLYAMGNVA